MRRIDRIKQAGRITTVLVVLALIIAASITSQNHRKSTEIKDVDVEIDFDSGISFVDEEDIIQTVELALGDKIVGMKLGMVELGEMEMILSKNPYVDAVEVSTGIDGTLYIEIVQKMPVLRIINTVGVSYYLSDKGHVIPLSDKFTARVMVVTGYVEGSENGQHPGKEKMARNLTLLSELIQADKFFQALVDQVYVQANGEIALVPKVGCKDILIGEVDNEVWERMNKVKLFYEEGLMEVGLNRYQTIDTRFNEQIVCTLK